MENIPPELEPFVKSEMGVFHEFLEVLKPELATTKLDKRDIYFISRKIQDAFDIYELALNLFKTYYKDAPPEEFEGEEIDPYNIYIKTDEGYVKLDPEKGIDRLCKRYALKVSMNLLVFPFAFAFLNKSLGGFIAKLGGGKEEEENVEKIIKGGGVKI